MAARATGDVAFEAIDVLGGYFQLAHRSPTLDGSMPLRAAQFCTPFVEGSGAGVQIWAPPSVLKRAGRRVDFFSLVPAPNDETYDAAMRRLADADLLGKEWLRRLADGLVWQTRDTLYLWTGHVIRPRPNAWLLVSSAYNRRTAATILDLVIPESDAFAPLLVKVDVSKVRDQPLSLDGELACILALRPGVAVERVPLKRRPEVLKRVAGYFDGDYFARKAIKATGKYRSLVAGATPSESTPARLSVIDLGSARFDVRTFREFVGPSGIDRSYVRAGDVEHAVVRAQTSVTVRWDGYGWSHEHGRLRGADELRTNWQRVCGGDPQGMVDRYCRYAVFGFPIEPVFNLLPWIFLESPPGWACFLDALPVEGAEGLRGVTRTDVFHQSPAAFRALAAGTLHIRAGTPLMRVLPVPARLVRPGFEMLDLRPA
jgi:hypothetical protein